MTPPRAVVSQAAASVHMAMEASSLVQPVGADMKIAGIVAAVAEQQSMHPTSSPTRQHDCLPFSVVSCSAQ